jgi:hypothetical protein
VRRGAGPGSAPWRSPRSAAENILLTSDPLSRIIDMQASVGKPRRSPVEGGSADGVGPYGPGPALETTLQNSLPDNPASASRGAIFMP